MLAVLRMARMMLLYSFVAPKRACAPQMGGMRGDPRVVCFKLLCSDDDCGRFLGYVRSPRFPCPGRGVCVLV